MSCPPCWPSKVSDCQVLEVMGRLADFLEKLGEVTEAPKTRATLVILLKRCGSKGFSRMKSRVSE